MHQVSGGEQSIRFVLLAVWRQFVALYHIRSDSYICDAAACSMSSHCLLLFSVMLLQLPFSAATGFEV